MTAIVVAALAFVVPPFVPALSSLAPRAQWRPRILLVADDDDRDGMVRDFAAEARRRQAEAREQGASDEAEAREQGASDEEPFRGIREIVLDESGRPIAIERRPAPAPSFDMRSQLADLISSPSFLFGVLISVASVVLLLAIAGADAQVNSR